MRGIYDAFLCAPIESLRTFDELVEHLIKEQMEH